ncbi:DMT family transporter [Histidinibacterium aquaticum]
MSAHERSPLAGIAWMAATGINFVAVTAIVKHLGGRIPAAESAFIRFLLGLVFLLPVLGTLRRHEFTRRQLRLFAGRGAAHTLGVMLWFYAMTRITIAEVTAMNYMNPVYVTVGAALLLGEPLPPRRLAAVGAALLGAFIILRPGFRALDPGHFAMIGTAIFFAAGYLQAKRLSDDVPASVVVAMLSITVTIGLGPFALAVWVWPTPVEVAWLFAVAAFATTAHYCMTRAFAAAPLTVTQPVTFLQLVWAMILGAAVFGEPVDGWVVLGGTIIVGSVTFITWREQRARRRVTPGVHEPKGY